MDLADRITGRVAELTGEVELLRKQLADAGHELERLVIAGQVITQLMTDEEAAGGGPAQRGFGLLVPPRSQASGTGDLPGDYRSLMEAVAAASAETGGPVTCLMAAQRAGLDVTGRQGRERPRQAQAARRPRLAAPQRRRQVHHRARLCRRARQCGGRCGLTEIPRPRNHAGPWPCPTWR
jgi:hypothetical protein